MAELAVRCILHQLGLYRVFVFVAVVDESFRDSRNSDCFSCELKSIHHIEALGIFLLLCIFDKFTVLLLDIAATKIAEYLAKLVCAQAVHQISLEH